MDPQTLALIQQVFTDNNIAYDATDYAVVKVEDMLVSLGPEANNSFLYLAPITTSSNLKPLRLPYMRRNIDVVMIGLNPYFFDATEDTVVKEVLDQVNASLRGALVLKKTDFYDTCLVTDNGGYYITLFAHPNSLFYRGSKDIPQRSRTDPFHLSFYVELTPRVV
jgi:hypothetical protein